VLKQDSGIGVKKTEEERWRGMMIGWSNEGLEKGWRKVRSRQILK
jgi:hypothetical protein